MFPYPHRNNSSIGLTSFTTTTDKNSQQQKTTLDDAIRTDLQQVLIPLYLQRLQTYQRQLQLHHPSDNAVNNTNDSKNNTRSIFTTVFLPHFRETKMGVLLRLQSIVTTTSIANDTTNATNATTTTTNVSNQRNKRRRPSSPSTTTNRKVTATTKTHFYYGGIPTQRCDLHSYLQFVFSIVQDQIDVCQRQMLVSTPFVFETDDDTNKDDDNDSNIDEYTIRLYTLSFYIFTFYTLIQMLHPPSSTSSAISTNHNNSSNSSTITTIDGRDSSNSDSILSYLSMGVQSPDNPKVLYRRMYYHHTKIRMTMQSYYRMVQLLVQTQQRRQQFSSGSIHPTCRRQASIVPMMYNDIILILQRLIHYTDQYFDLSSYHGPCHLEGYTWRKHDNCVSQQPRQNQRQSQPPVQEVTNAINAQALIAATASKPPDDDASTDSDSVKLVTTHTEDKIDDATSTIRQQLQLYIQIKNQKSTAAVSLSPKGIENSTFSHGTSSDGMERNNPLEHLLLTYYSVGSGATLSNPLDDGSTDDVVNLEESTVTTNHIESTIPFKTNIHPVTEPQSIWYTTDDPAPGHCETTSVTQELEEALVWEDSDDEEDNNINQKDDNDNDGELSGLRKDPLSTQNATIEEVDSDNQDSIVSPNNNIGQTALSKLLLHVTDHPQSTPRPSNFSYGDFFLGQQQMDLNDGNDSNVTTIERPRKGNDKLKKTNSTKRNESKTRLSGTKKTMTKTKLKKSLSLTPTVLNDDDDDELVYGKQQSDDCTAEDDLIDDDGNDNIDDDDDFSTHTATIATPGQDALLKLLSFARPT